MAGETSARERLEERSSRDGAPEDGSDRAPAPERTPPGEKGAEPSAGGRSASPADEPVTKKRRSWVGRLTEIPMLIVLAFVIAIVIKTFLVQAFYIPSGSMNPTLQVGDRVLVEKVGYRIGSTHRGQIVVFERDVFEDDPDEDLGLVDRARITLRELLGLPTGRQEDYIKRIVAVGGDTIRYARSPRQLVVNGEPVDEDYLRGGEDSGSPTLTGRDCRRLEMKRVGGACRVPAGRVFVMGDNRSNSEDSRVLGPIGVDKIVGRAFVVIWPPGNVGGL